MLGRNGLRRCSTSVPAAVPSAPGPAFAQDWEAASKAQARPVVLKPSSSKWRKPSIFFASPTASVEVAPGQTADDVVRPPEHRAPEGSVTLDTLGFAMPLYKVTSPTCDYFALRIPLIKAGFKRLGPTHGGVDANVLWGKSWPATAFRKGGPMEDRWRHARPVHRFQAINHFAGSHATLGCKAGMARTLELAAGAAAERGAGELAGALEGLTPQTWRLPEDRHALLAELDRADDAGRRYIMKPARGSCGRGIRVATRTDRLLRRIAEARDGTELAALMEPPPPESTGPDATPPEPLRARQVVVQRYMENPLLVNGRKFDLRLYVAATSFEPLVAYLHRDGLVRFAAEAYTPDDAGNRFAHLTNYSLGRRLEARKSRELAVAMGIMPASALDAAGDDGPDRPSDEALPKVSLDLKCTLRKLYSDITASHGAGRCEQLQRDIDRIIATTLAAGSTMINRIAAADFDGGVNRCSFELFGFDIMIDADLRPWLVEVNTLPSLESSSPLDYAVKSAVSADLLNVAQLQLFDRLPDAFMPTQEDELSAPFRPPALDYAPSEVAKAGLAHPLQAAWSGSGDLGPLGPALSRADSAEDTVARVQDEGRYAGGFRRIIPTPGSADWLRPIVTESADRTLPYSTEAVWRSLGLVP